MREICAVVVAAAILAACLPGCGGQRSPYVKSLTLSPASPTHTMFRRLEGAFRRRDLDVAMDCIDHRTYRNFPRAETRLVELFRHADDMRFSLRPLGSVTSYRGLRHEVAWSMSWTDIYDRNRYVDGGTAYLTISPGPVARITDIEGHDPFLP